MELIIGFIVAMIMLALLTEDERVGADQERVWVNHLADRSRARKAPTARRRCRYSMAMYRPGK